MKPLEILLVEDDIGDVDLTREALKEGQVLVHLNVVEDGVKALQYLRRGPPYAQAAKPDLVLLDLNLPRKDGREVLKEMKNDEELKSIPVVILTTSDTDRDVVNIYGLGGNCYVTKPVGFEKFAKVIHEIEHFWFHVVKLPA